MREHGQRRKREQRPGTRGSALRTSRAHPVPQQQQACDHERQHHDREHAVRPSPPQRQRGVAAGKARQHVDVGSVGADHERGGRERRCASQTRGRERGAGEGVRDRIHLSAVTPDHAAVL